MVDVDVALTWIALSAASARGLTALARATVSQQGNIEPAATGVPMDCEAASSGPRPLGAFRAVPGGSLERR